MTPRGTPERSPHAEAALHKAFGPNAKWLFHIDQLGGRIVKQVQQQDEMRKDLGKMTPVCMS